MPEGVNESSSMSTPNVCHPPVEWAQRKEVIFLTITVDDCKIETLSVENDKLVFKGQGGAEHHVYEGTIQFYDEVIGQDYRRITSDRSIQLVIPKKKVDHFWPRLTKDKQKVHWIKVDFNKWKDEDEESDTEKENGFDLNNMMGQMGGGMNFDDKPDLDDLEDSDNEDLEDDAPEEEEDSTEKTETTGSEKTQDQTEEGGKKE